MTRKTQKKLRKLLTLVCCAVMLVCVTVGATVAYLTSQDSVVNTFTVGKVGITMDETDVDENGVAIEGADRVDNNEYKLMPGHTYTKDPTIHIEDTTEESYLALTVAISNADKTDALFGTGTGVNITDILVGLDLNKWEISSSVTNNVRTYILIAKNTIKGGDADIVVFNQVKVPGTITNAQLDTLNNTTMTINAYAVQKDGFTSANAALNAAWPAIFPAA